MFPGRKVTALINPVEIVRRVCEAVEQQENRTSSCSGFTIENVRRAYSNGRMADERHAGLTKREHVRVNAGVEELDLKGAILYLPLLPNELI